MKLGRFFDTEEIYNKEPHLRNSHIKEIVKSPAHMKAAMDKVFADSRAFDEGKAVHSVLLEQNLDKFIKRPAGIDGRTKDGKAKLDELKATGKIILDADVFDSMYDRLKVFVNSNEAMKLYNGATIEESFYTAHAISGMLLKARPDIYKPGIMADIKTTSNMAWFEKDIVKYGYHIQAGFYSLVTRLVTGIKTKEFVFIAQEKVAPYGIQVFSINESQLNVLEEKATELIFRASVSIKENHFPCFDDVKKEIVLPAYALTNDSFFEEVG